MSQAMQQEQTAHHYVPTFHFDKSKACYCGSRKAFGSCCASLQDQSGTTKPRFINVIPNFIPQEECFRFIRHAEKQKREWLPVVADRAPASGKRAQTFHDSRKTERVYLKEKQATAIEWMATASRNFLVRSGQQVQWIEPPQLLRYGKGGKYDVHADAENFCANTNQFYRFIDRDFSMLIYLNEGYEGGELYFPGLDYRYKPKMGDLVFFPSNHVFLHQSLPIKKGIKYSLVTWGAIAGSARVSKPKSTLSVC